jgi:hypothetical protein
LEIIIKSGFKNPPYVIESTQNLEFWDNENNLIARESVIFKYNPGNLFVKITSSSNRAGEVSTFTFSFTILNQISKGGFIMINFPHFNQNSGAKEVELKSCVSSTVKNELLNKKVI